METNSYIEQAASDLATIRRAVESVEKGNDPVSKESANKVSILIHQVALFASGLLLIGELMTGNLMTRVILRSANIESLRIDNLAHIGSSLFVACAFVYVLIGKITNDSNLDSSSFIARHFSYLTNYKFVTDLVVKFTIVSFIVIAQRPEWLGPVCSVFVADYLLQARFFVIPKTASLLAGVGCLIVGIGSFVLGFSQLAIPALLFSLVATASLTILHNEANAIKELV